MKKLLTILLCLVVLATAVSALQVSVSSLTFGGNSQDRDTNVTSTFTIKNNATTAANITLSHNIASKHNTVISPSSIQNLASGAEATITVTVFVPVDFDAVNEELVETAFTIGKLSIASNAANESTTEVSATLQARNRLRYKDGDMTITGATTRTKTIRDRTRVENLKPGDSLQLDITVDNQFPDTSRRDDRRNTDVEFRDVDIRLDFSSEEDFQIDEDQDTLSIDADNEEATSFSFDVEEDAADRTHTVDLRIDGRDEFGARHGEALRFSLEIKRDPHDLVLRSIDFSPLRIGCNRNVQLTATMLNRGRVDEREAAIQTEVSELGIIQRSQIVRIDEDDTGSANLNFKIQDNVKAGTYTARVFSLYDTATKNNFKDLTFVVEECKKEEPTTQPPVITQPPVVQPPIIQPPVVITPEPIVIPSETTEEETASYTWALVAGIIVAAALLVFVIIRFARR
ncbi:hypothetical protein HY486_02350 [Candidatus Woesearchaeota archaeon]|nr:hypothetical protein [Candidatus Woesearchaeota archaeon]